MAQDLSFPVIYRDLNAKTQHFGSGSTLVMDTGSTLDVSAATVTGGLASSVAKLSLGAATAETQAASTTIDTTKSYHSVAVDGANFTGASNFVASVAGSDGDYLEIQVVNTPANGTVTVTFTTRFKPSATLAVTQGHFASVFFRSNGTNWQEIGRSAIITV